MSSFLENLSSISHAELGEHTGGLLNPTVSGRNNYSTVVFAACLYLWMHFDITKERLIVLYLIKEGTKPSFLNVIVLSVAANRYIRQCL